MGGQRLPKETHLLSQAEEDLWLSHLICFHMAFISHQSNEMGHVIGLLPFFVKFIHIEI